MFDALARHIPLFLLLTVTALGVLLARGAPPVARRPIPVILDTDIGGDIDDTWALAMLLTSPELDLKLVVTDSHDTRGKAKIVAKFLQQVGRSDVPVGIGLKIDSQTGPQQAWTAGYALAAYPGQVYQDGVQAMLDMIRASNEPITLIAIGPVPNLEELLRRDPRITGRVRLVVMGGSVHRQYGGKPGRCAEYNVVAGIRAAQVAYAADWDVTVTPLDTAGVVRLTGQRYAAVRDADNPIAKALMENDRIWSAKHGHADASRASSILFDTVAIYLAFDHRLCQMHDMRLQVDDKGFTLPAPHGKRTHVALDWKDLDTFEKMLSERIAHAR